MKEQNFDLIKIDNQIGIRKYEYLRSLKFDDLSEIQKKQIEDYESKSKTQTPEQKKKQTEYFKRILEPVEEKEFSITAKELWVLFKANFQEVNKRPFVKIEGITIKNLEPLIYYFSKDERFFECENLKKELSVPSFEKGILIIGNFGNGKTSTMKVFEKIFKGIKGIGFKGFSTNEVVMMFEKCTGDKSDVLRDEFNKLMFSGSRYFDDLKTERIASNFGKVNIFKEILEERYNRKSKTHGTCNFKKDFPNDFEMAIQEFQEKYESRVYDRIFEMFNIIEFKGKSFRK